MNDTTSLLLAGGAGALLGAGFFGGLWYTVRRGLSSTRPALWFLGSLLLRTSVVLAGFYLVGAGRWARLLACLIGFLMARLVVTRLASPPLERHDSPAEVPGHAPQP